LAAVYAWLPPNVLLKVKRGNAVAAFNAGEPVVTATPLSIGYRPLRMTHAMKTTHERLARYGLAMLILLVAVLARVALVPVMGLNVPYVTIYPAIMIAAVAFGVGPGMLAALAGILLAEHLFMRPGLGIAWDLSLAVRSALLFGATLYLGWIGRSLRAARAMAEEEAVAARAARDTLEDRVKERTAELEQARTGVETERQRLYAVLDTLPVYVVLLSGDYRVPFANRFFEERFGKSGGRCCYDYLFQRTEPCENCESFKAMKTGQPHHWEWTGPDNCNYDIYDFPFKDNDGSMMVLEMGIDITVQKRAAAELRKHRESLEQLVRERTEKLQAINADLIESRRAALNLMNDALEARRQAEQASEALTENEARVRRKLDSVLSPEGDLDVLELRDILDIPAIQALMDHFYKLSRFPMSILDLKGNVLVGAGWQEICMRFHRVHPDTCRNCVESDLRLSAGVPPGEFRLYRCKNNMWDIATPIVVGGRHVGNVFSGQFFFADEPLDYDLFRAQALRYGFDEKAYLTAVEAVPRLSRETVEAGMAFLTRLTEILSRLSYGNIKLARLVVERDSLLVSIKASEQQLNRAQAIGHLGAWDLDLVKNQLTWSDEVYRIFGLRPREFEATYEAFLERVHPDDRAAVDAAYSGSLREQRDSYEIDHRVVRKDTGEIRFVHERCEHQRSPDGRIVRSIGMVHDITERRQYEENLRRVNENLEQFAYVASHDLQEPLRTLSSFSQLLAKRYRGRMDQDADEFIGFIVEAAGRMQALIADLLAYSRAGHRDADLTGVDCNQVVRKAMKSLSATIASTGGSVTFDPLPTIEAHEPSMTQLFQNLIGNALKFRGEQPPRVHVSVRRIQAGEAGESPSRDGAVISPPDHDRMVSDPLPPDVWRFSVRDNGIGIDPKYHEKIFVIFQRLHPREQYTGTGVGLSICKRIVENHGGRIWVESTPGSGTAFHFILPAKRDRN